jgi:NTP pyrophosphatase (non-canonical NTP hydrolase)
MATIKEFQNLMHRLYFSRDSRRGVHATYEWLREEVDELHKAIEENNIEAIGEEMADVIAWLASLANILRLDLEEVAFHKYNGCCPKCSHTPCKCPFE